MQQDSSAAFVDVNGMKAQNTFFHVARHRSWGTSGIDSTYERIQGRDRNSVWRLPDAASILTHAWLWRHLSFGNRISSTYADGIAILKNGRKH